MVCEALKSIDFSKKREAVNEKAIHLAMTASVVVSLGATLPEIMAYEGSGLFASRLMLGKFLSSRVGQTAFAAGIMQHTSNEVSLSQELMQLTNSHLTGGGFKTSDVQTKKSERSQNREAIWWDAAFLVLPQVVRLSGVGKQITGTITTKQMESLTKWARLQPSQIRASFEAFSLACGFVDARCGIAMSLFHASSTSERRKILENKRYRDQFLKESASFEKRKLDEAERIHTMHSYYSANREGVKPLKAGEVEAKLHTYALSRLDSDNLVVIATPNGKPQVVKVTQLFTYDHQGFELYLGGVDRFGQPVTLEPTTLRSLRLPNAREVAEYKLTTTAIKQTKAVEYAASKFKEKISDAFKQSESRIYTLIAKAHDRAIRGNIKPSTIKWDKVIEAGPVLNQGCHGSCWAHASTPGVSQALKNLNYLGPNEFLEPNYYFAQHLLKQLQRGSSLQEGAHFKVEEGAHFEIFVDLVSQHGIVTSGKYQFPAELNGGAIDSYVKKHGYDPTIKLLRDSFDGVTPRNLEQPSGGDYNQSVQPRLDLSFATIFNDMQSRSPKKIQRRSKEPSNRSALESLIISNIENNIPVQLSYSTSHNQSK